MLVGKCCVIDASVHQRQFNISAVISSSSSSAAARGKNESVKVKGDKMGDEVAEDDESMGRIHTITQYKDAICNVCGMRHGRRTTNAVTHRPKQSGARKEKT